MHYILDNWSFDPFVIIVASSSSGTRSGSGGWPGGPGRSAPGTADPVTVVLQRPRVLLLAVDSPIDYWSSSYFIVHMVQHLLLMFAAPSLVVAGAPGSRCWTGCPADPGRRCSVGARARLVAAVRAVFHFVTGPVVAVVIFNAVMVLWHLPVLFDLAENNQLVHIWLMHSSFFLAGVLFWLQFIPSPLFHSRMPVLGRAAALLATTS